MTVGTPLPDHLAWMNSLSGETVACRCHRSGGPHRPLAALLSVSPLPRVEPCRARVGVLKLAQVEGLAEAACVVADTDMRWRCNGAPASYRHWRDAVNAGKILTGRCREMVEPFITTVFGSPVKPKPDGHVRGWVADFVSFQSLSNCPIGQAERSAESRGRASTPPNRVGWRGFRWRRCLDGREPRMTARKRRPRSGCRRLLAASRSASVGLWRESDGNLSQKRTGGRGPSGERPGGGAKPPTTCAGSSSSPTGAPSATPTTTTRPPKPSATPSLSMPASCRPPATSRTPSTPNGPAGIRSVTTPSPI